MSHKMVQEHDSATLDALPNTAVLGDNASDPGGASVATTTKHPRHRPGCSCIVCIQPPSGKGKHKPTCTCNVCMTVKRRFKTLMMRKKKRQTEREAEIAQRNHYLWGSKDEAEVDSTITHHDPPANKGILVNELQLRDQINNLSHKTPEIGKGGLDLNSDPEREEQLHQGSTRVSMMSLLQVASLPLETYLKQNGLTSLISEQEGSSGSQSLPPATTGESEGPVHEDHCVVHVVQEHESRDDELDNSRNDPS